MILLNNAFGFGMRIMHANLSNLLSGPNTVTYAHPQSYQPRNLNICQPHMITMERDNSIYNDLRMFHRPRCIIFHSLFYIYLHFHYYSAHVSLLFLLWWKLLEFCLILLHPIQPHREPIQLKARSGIKHIKLLVTSAVLLSSIKLTRCVIDRGLLAVICFASLWNFLNQCQTRKNFVSQRLDGRNLLMKMKTIPTTSFTTTTTVYTDWMF